MSPRITAGSITCRPFLREQLQRREEEGQPSALHLVDASRVFQSTCGRGLKLSTDGQALVVASRRVGSRDGEKRRRFLFPRGRHPYGAGLTEGGHGAERRDAARRAAPRRAAGASPRACVRSRVPESRRSRTLSLKNFPSIRDNDFVGQRPTSLASTSVPETGSSVSSTFLSNSLCFYLSRLFFFFFSLRFTRRHTACVSVLCTCGCMCSGGTSPGSRISAPFLSLPQFSPTSLLFSRKENEHESWGTLCLQASSPQVVSLISICRLFVSFASLSLSFFLLFLSLPFFSRGYVGKHVRPFLRPSRSRNPFEISKRAWIRRRSTFLP
ncbi:hypothetical protein PUN28_012227 [Cardiocondyla obscurior]|uniref:Transmembrane protein n=1 Tax=Cardiocondyla obscurior TaxID=286306 RepID=A0AAW2FBD7_9HYME